MFLENSQNSHNFQKFHKICRPAACNFIKKEALAQVFSCEFCESSKILTQQIWWLLLQGDKSKKYEYIFYRIPSSWLQTIQYICVYRQKTHLILPVLILDEDRSSRPEVFCKKGVLRNFGKFTGKHLCQSLFFDKVFSCEFCTEHLWWLLLTKRKNWFTFIFSQKRPSSNLLRHHK